ncbi:MAG: 50S ribosomal protein L6 [Candidatus Aenigmarchaeota archaeon]|nr:50S ribosomal protein L6 [Candidatus Aenigmarchaeota archaeon]
MEIEIPSDVTVNVDDRKVIVKGPKSTIEKDFDDPRFNATIRMHVDGSKFIVDRVDEKKKSGAMAGSIIAHTRNMIIGVTKGYNYTLKIVYSHFPMSVTIADGKISVKNFLGEKGARVVDVVGDAKVHVDKEEVSVTGANLEHVSQTAANIERACKLRGKDRRIFQDGIYITGRHVQK